MSNEEKVEYIFNNSLINESNSDSGEELAIDIRNAYFQYKSNHKVLDNLSLRVPKGQVFALLGPNGIGKTTLIRLILGLIHIKSGSIQVFGNVPGTKYSDIPGKGVGYMPQELALYEEFTIEEILKYYGTIFHLKDKELKENMKNLKKLLNLPEMSRIINRLSGGQQRRVSIAVSMIHRPKLIILDEPTVGVDSILRHRIWRYLQQCCQQFGQTVLITTHYIEEAKSASNVAFMNYGSIIKQSNPQKLLQEYNCQTFETLFLYLCQQNKSNNNSDTDQQNIELNSVQKNTKRDNSMKEKPILRKSFDFYRIKATIYTLYLQLIRKPLTLFMFYLFPIFSIIMSDISLSDIPKHTPLVIYIEDNQDFSNQFINNINKHYINYRMSDNNESAFQSVVNGSALASVVFSTNFTQDFENRFTSIDDITDEELENTKIKVYADFSNALKTVTVFNYIFKAFNKLLKQNRDVFGNNGHRFFHSIYIEETFYGEIKFDYRSIHFSGLILGVIHMFPFMFSSLQIILNRQNRNVERGLVSGVRPLEMIVSHFIQNCILITTLNIFVIFIAFVVLNNTNLGHYLDVFLILFLTGLQGSAFGLFLGLISDRPISVMGGLLGYNFPMLLLSGVYWTVESLPPILYKIVLLGPLAQPLLGLRAILFRGWSYDKPVVYLSFVIQITYITIFTIINTFLFAKSIKK